jgi:protein phosphatase 1L
VDYLISFFPLIGETYKKTDSEFLDSEVNTHRDDGSTASTAVLVGNHLYVANVGDSRAVISKSGKGDSFSMGIMLFIG